MWRSFGVLSSDFSSFFRSRSSILNRFSSSYGIMSNTEVNHDIQEGYFFIDLGKDKAVLEYEKEGKNTLNMWHTEVPVSHRGQGLAAHLAKAALDHAVENNLRVKPTCSYIQKYLKDNPLPQYTERVLPAEQ
ncbi:protein NATD1-like [Actinia tenebrosa]|uniref:Protein NATD1 n=1 Tax=Actinia tenebrosa TaxID=6105 RepID=A0A6P8HC34_ACTTE|nr:protein NATD1-like [Actinia tenebrosa]